MGDLFRRETRVLLICFIVSFICMIISAVLSGWGIAWYFGVASIGFSVWIVIKADPKLSGD